jgi:hypothetical protein
LQKWRDITFLKFQVLALGIISASLFLIFLAGSKEIFSQGKENARIIGAEDRFFKEKHSVAFISENILKIRKENV